MRNPRIDLAGIVIDLADEKSAVTQILDHAADPPMVMRCSVPLSVVSANLDHIAQFGRGGRWEGTIGDSLYPTATPSPAGQGRMEWLTLVDGAPLVARANTLTGHTWPRLAGSDLIRPIIDGAEARGLTVGFLGGSPAVQEELARVLPKTHPKLKITGLWCPDRPTLADPTASKELAAQIRATSTDILVVGLGKPRQELWMAKYGAPTGAKVLLAFGAVVDFLAGAVQRAPRWAADNGVEWAWRLALEPRRLAHRYLVDDPPAFVQIRRDAAVIPADRKETPPYHYSKEALPSGGPGTFVGWNEDADVTACIVTYNSEESIDNLLESLRSEAGSLKLKVVVADNDSGDDTLAILRTHPDVHVVPTGGNLGYAAGLNAAFRAAGKTGSYLVLNPDLEVRPGSITALFERLVTTGAGVVVPKLLDADGEVYPSLRHEPNTVRTLAYAVLGERMPNRPAWMNEEDRLPEAYQHAHQIVWATGAALMVDADLAEKLGDWDERFFLYSEETDYFRRARQTGASIWYEPSSVMVHTQGGSGSSPALDALLAVSRVRYARKYAEGGGAGSIRAALVLREALRAHKPDHRTILRTLVDEAKWQDLPGPAPAQNYHPDPSFPAGSIIIPAHNEASVIGSTLSALQPIAHLVEIIVVCNGCSDKTAAIARRFPGIQVIELRESSKTAALNAGDAIATRWPRLYLDADITISPVAVRLLFDRLNRGDILAARPSFRHITTGASWPVHAFARSKARMPDSQVVLWGAGAYAVSERGRARFGTFPTVTADDLFADLQFSESEKAIVVTPPVPVHLPRTTKSLLGVLRRTYRGQAEILRSSELIPHLDTGQTTGKSARCLLRGIVGPASLIDAVVAAGLIAKARLDARQGSPVVWERDDSTRPVSELPRHDAGQTAVEERRVAGA